MKTPSLASVDLNLLVTLDALLTERHVSRAASRLSLTQSALSRALGRLRDTFGDELLVRTGHGMRPTRFALELIGPLRRALAELERIVLAERQFDPRTAERRFRLAGVDYAAVTLLGPLSRALEQTAPGIDFAVRPLTPEADRELETGELDLLLEPRRASGAGIVWVPLHADRYTAVVANDHPASRLSLREFAAARHVLVSPWGRPGSVVDDALAAHGVTRRIAVELPSFLLLPDVLVGTRRVAALPERMARHLCALHPLKVLELPVDVPGFTMCMAWHEVHRHDPGHAWLRARLAQSVESPGAPARESGGRARSRSARAGRKRGR